MGTGGQPACAVLRREWRRHHDQASRPIGTACSSIDMAALACATPRWSPFAAAPARGAQQQPRRQGGRLRVRAEKPQGSDEGSAPPEQPPVATPPPPPLSDPAALVVYGGRLPPARRLLVSGLTATAIGEQLFVEQSVHSCHFHMPCSQPLRPALVDHLPLAPSPSAALGGNLFGVTSWLLSLDGGQLAESSRLDVLVPVNGYRRCLDAQNGEQPPCCAPQAAPRSVLPLFIPQPTPSAPMPAPNPCHPPTQALRLSTRRAGWQTKPCIGGMQHAWSSRRRWTLPAWRGHGRGGQARPSQPQPTARPAAAVRGVVRFEWDFFWWQKSSLQPARCS